MNTEYEYCIFPGQTNGTSSTVVFLSEKEKNQ
jgi:hypothetical protein